MAALTNDEILEAIANMTVQQAADLVKAMEEKFGVSAAAPVAVAAGPAAAAEEEQTEFTVTLESIDPAKKMDVITFLTKSHWTFQDQPSIAKLIVNLLEPLAPLLLVQT